jgi:hypothetical protein
MAQQRPIVLVFDAEGSRLTSDRLREALSSALGVPVIRLGEAETAEGTITVAFTRPSSWTLHASLGERARFRRVELRRARVNDLVELVESMVAELRAETTPPRPAVLPPSQGEWVVLISDGLIDPFVDVPIRRHGRSVPRGLLDPFVTSRVSSHPDVIDPWSP